MCLLTHEMITNVENMTKRTQKVTIITKSIQQSYKIHYHIHKSVGVLYTSNKSSEIENNPIYNSIKLYEILINVNEYVKSWRETTKYY